jgi:hypothetical protein
VNRGTAWLLLVAAPVLGNGVLWLIGQRIGMLATSPRSWVINGVLVTLAFVVYGLFVPACCRHCKRGEERKP